jgi:Protein of unknown function (DUF2807).
MRKLSLAALVAAAAVAASSCGSFVIGNGTIESEARSVGSFSSIRVEGSGQLRVHKGNQYVEVSSDSNILPYITTRVSGSTLVIGFKSFTSITGATKLAYDVTLPSLDGVTLSGSGDAIVDAFSGSSFTGTITGSGSITATFAYDKIKLASSGSGGATLAGSATAVELGITGSGAIYAKDLAASSATTSISGSGNIEVRASTSLSANIYGSGSVFYYGSPVVSQTISGSGHVAKGGD